MPCCTLLYLAVPCCIVLYLAVPCCALLCLARSPVRVCVSEVKPTVEVNTDLVSRPNCTHTHTQNRNTHTHTHTHTHNQHIRLEYAFDLSLEPTITHAHCICIHMYLSPTRSYQPHNDAIAPLHTSASGTIYLDDQTIPSSPSGCDRHWASVRTRTTAQNTTHY